MPKNKNAEPRPGFDIKPWIPLITPVVAAVLAALITCIGDLYLNHWNTPKLKCDPSSDRDRFYVEDDYRALKISLRPQIVVRYGGHVVLLSYLKDYYENELVIFSDGSGTAEKTDQDMTDALLFFIRESLLERLEQSCGETVMREIEPNLSVYISVLGGVTYTNERGNYDKLYCIIVEDGSVLDYSAKEEIISNRLFEYKIEIPDDSAGMEQDESIETLIQSVAEHISENYLTEAGKGGRAPSYVTPAAGIAVILLLAYEACHWHRKLLRRARRLPQTLRKLDLVQKLALIAVVMIATGTMTAAAVEAVTTTSDEKLDYENLDIAEQIPIKSLFTPQQPKEPEEQPQWPAEEVLARLHIPQKFVGLGISQPMLDYYDHEFKEIYLNGTGNPPDNVILPEWFEIESGAYTSLDGEIYETIEAEVNKCSYSKRPTNLYHLGRVLTDTVLTHAELDFETLFDIAADGIACEESFLTYEDRSIGEGDENNIKNAEDIALRNGKVYWALANDLESIETSTEYQGYAGCFLAAGFKCVELGRSRTSVDDPEYLKLTYYLGNFCERMLDYISQPELYKSIGAASMAYYREALDLLESDGGMYLKEHNMESNIHSGMSTLSELGF